MSTFNGLDVKREITDKRPKGDDRAALLSGFTRSCLALERKSGSGGFVLCLECQIDFVRDYIASLMRDAFMVTPRSDDKTALRYADCEKLLSALYLTDRDGGGFMDDIPSKYVHSVYYARGVFLGCGSVSVPRSGGMETRSTGYHLEFSFGSENFADAFTKYLEGYGIKAHRSTRAEKSIVYVKDSESVSDCLALVGADKSVLKLNDTVATFAVKRDLIRQINCEMANMDRTVQAAGDIVSAIEVIDKKIGLDALDEKLYKAAQARMADVEAPLSKIAAELGISKSGLKHRLNRIIETARALDSKEEE